MTKQTSGNPLQYSCLENSMDWGAWQATVHGVSKSRTRLRLSKTNQRCEHLDVKKKIILTSSRNILFHIKGNQQQVTLGSCQDCVSLLVLLQFCPTEPRGTTCGHVPGLQRWASKTLSGETLTVLGSTSTLPIISLMKDHSAEILRVEGHRCLHSSHLYTRGNVTLGGNLGNVK